MAWDLRLNMLPSSSVSPSPKTKCPQPEFSWQFGGWLIRENGIQLGFSAGYTEPKRSQNVFVSTKQAAFTKWHMGEQPQGGR